jgi:hypothetical protein
MEKMPRDSDEYMHLGGKLRLMIALSCSDRLSELELVLHASKFQDADKVNSIEMYGAVLH